MEQVIAMKLSPDFAHANFQNSTQDERKLLVSRLASALGRLVEQGPDFHRAVANAIEQLRQLGHDLWSFDEGDSFSIWCGDYTKQTRAPELVLEFRVGQRVNVEFRDEMEPL